MDSKNNTGNYNTGNYNTGNRNTGDCNTGDRNTGDCNTGDCNTGNYNTGDRNTGDRNTGNYNTGNYNTGDLNTGNRNTGDCNTGDCNTGNYNTGDCNTGFFCTNTSNPIFFDFPSNLSWDEAYNAIPYVELSVGVEWIPSDEMSETEKIENSNHLHVGGYLKKHELPLREAFPLAWAKLNDATKQRFINLPNFDAKKFLQITGVDVRIPAKPDIIVIDGVR